MANNLHCEHSMKSRAETACKACLDKTPFYKFNFNAECKHNHDSCNCCGYFYTNGSKVNWPKVSNKVTEIDHVGFNDAIDTYQSGLTKLKAANDNLENYLTTRQPKIKTKRLSAKPRRVKQGPLVYIIDFIICCVCVGLTLTWWPMNILFSILALAHFVLAIKIWRSNNKN